MLGLGVEEHLGFGDAVVGDADDVTIPAALASAPQRPELRHCAVATGWKLACRGGAFPAIRYELWAEEERKEQRLEGGLEQEQELELELEL